MLVLTDPREAYRRSEIEARIHGVADPSDIVRLCVEQLVGSLGLALIASERRDVAVRSKALSRALSALIALEMGVDQSAPLADALSRFYGAARHTMLESVVSFDSEALGRLRQDFLELGQAFQSAQDNPAHTERAGSPLGAGGR